MHLEKWTSTVNPLHVIGGALWIGTLFVIVAAGVPVRSLAVQRRSLEEIVLDVTGAGSDQFGVPA